MKTNTSSFLNLDIESIITVPHLLSLERRLLTSIIESIDNFFKIEAAVISDDFTFIHNQVIFERLCERRDEMIKLSKKEDKEELFTFFTKLLYDLICEEFMSKVDVDNLLQEITDNLEADLAEFTHYTKQKNNDCTVKNTPFVEITFDERESYMVALFQNSRLSLIDNGTFSTKIPIELCDTLGKTMELLFENCTGDDCDHRIQMYEHDSFEIDFCIDVTKNISDQRSINKLQVWGKEHLLKPKELYPNRRYLLGKGVLSLSSKNISYLPEEIDYLKNLVILELDNNDLSTLPNTIGHMRSLEKIDLNKNNITTVPDSLYDLKKLSHLYLHANPIKSLSDKISQLQNLVVLSISNTDIKELPSTIGQLKKLNWIYLENTLIDKIPLEILSFPNLGQIRFDDKHLEFFVKNKHLLKKINAINLSESHYESSSPLVQELRLKIDTQSTWMEDKNRRDNGCIMLQYKLSVVIQNYMSGT